MLKAKKRYIVGLGLLIGLGIAPAAIAQQSSSPDYQVNEVFFGTGGELNSCSTGQFCSKQSAGETAVGKTCSGNQYCAQAGFNTDRIPSLTFIVNTTNVDLGILTPGITSAKTATFSVKSYLSSGYVVKTYGPGPTNTTGLSSYTLSTLTSPSLSNTSQEQFGINLANNTSCGITGLASSADPSQLPNSTFGFGTVTSNYNQPCKFLYNSGDTVAHSLTSSGTTQYTISYIFNSTRLTPAGTYVMHQSLVATATY